MKRLLAALTLLCSGFAAHAAQPAAGQALIVVLDSNGGVSGLSVVLDGADLATTDASGAATINAGSGPHELALTRGPTRVAFATFRLDDTEAAEIVVRTGSGNAEAKVKTDIFAAANPGTATLLGYVTDETGNVVANAKISIAEAGVETSSDENGYFEVEVPRGSYELTATSPAGVSRTFSDVRASPNLESGIQFALVERRAAPTGGGAIEEVVATARYIPDTATALERNSESVLDVISSTEIAIAGDGNAAAALQRVTGVTLVNGLVFVRGLGDRYSTTLVNGAELPSPDPTRRVIALDLFPTDLLGGITVQKTYSPELPGDFSGGAVLLETKAIPNDFNASIQGSIGANNRTTFRRGLTYAGGETDSLGFDDGTRDIPDTAQQLTNNGQTPLIQLSDTDRERVAESLVSNYDLKVLEYTPGDSGATISIGNRYTGWDVAEIGFQASALYDNDWRFRREQRADIRRGAGATASIFRDQDLQRSEHHINSGGILSVAADFSEDNQLSFSSLLSNQATKGTFYGEGSETDSGVDTRDITLDWIETSLLSNQLNGHHVLPDFHELGIDWQLVYSNATRDVLDRREYTYSRPTGSDNPYRLAFDPGSGGIAPTRSWEFLDENTYDGGVGITLPVVFTDSIEGKFKVGARVTQRERDFRLVRFQFAAPSIRNDAFDFTAGLPSLNQVLRPDTIGPNNSLGLPSGWVLRNAQSQTSGGGNADSYDASQDIIAFYGLGDFTLSDAWRLQLGVRREDSEILTRTAGGGSGVADARVKDTDYLPAVTLTWFIDDDQQLRLGASKTVNRPQFRELSPTEFRDPETRRLSVGNPNLREAKITNADIRYEYYWTAQDSVSIGAFYKDFTDPIELILLASGSELPVRSYANISSATDYGLEIDARKGLDFLADTWDPLGYLYVGGNVSLIKSEINITPTERGVLTDPNRALQGQSPWIVNTTFGFSHPSWQTDIALLFNMFGERINEAGTRGLPDAKEQSYPLLDLNIRQGIGQSWRIGLKFRNLLDPAIEVTQGGVIQRRYKLGISSSLSAEYKF